jgi:hypothetical protein
LVAPTIESTDGVHGVRSHSTPLHPSRALTLRMWQTFPERIENAYKCNIL